MSSRAVLMLALAASMCAPAAGCRVPRKKAPDGSVIRIVRNVEIRGNKKLSDSRLEGGLATREPRGWLRRKYSALDAFDVERDRARIVAYYRRHGFFLARVTAVRIEKVGKRRADVVFVVNEGPEAKVRELSIEGGPDVAGLRRGDLVRLSELEVGKRFNYEDFQDSKWKIKDALVLAGYARARVTGTAEVDRSNFAVSISLEVDTGPRTSFGATRVTGNELVPESSVRARLAWDAGDRFEPRKLAETRRRLLSLGRFSTVRVDLEGPRERPAADVKVTVSEAPRNELRLGAGFGVDTANWLFRGRAGYKRHGVFDPLNTLSVDLRPAYALVRKFDEFDPAFVGEATASLVREDLWVPRLRGISSVAYTRQEVESYKSNGARLRLALTRGFLAERLRVGVGWRYHFLQVDPSDVLRLYPDTKKRLGVESSNDDADPEASDAVLYALGFFEQSLAYDGRDNPIDARRGVYAEVRVEEAGPWAAGTFSFIKLTPELRAYLPLGTNRAVLAGRARAGKTLAGELPITQRYYAGGSSSQRGFAQRRLSPTVSDGQSAVQIGGDALIETNAELRLDIRRLGGEWLGVVLFMDGADATDQEAIDLGNLHWAAGFGLRYNTVVGPIRFDFGWRLNRLQDLAPNSRYAFHLSLGEAF